MLLHFFNLSWKFVISLFRRIVVIGLKEWKVLNNTNSTHCQHLSFSFKIRWYHKYMFFLSTIAVSCILMNNLDLLNNCYYAAFIQMLFNAFQQKTCFCDAWVIEQTWRQLLLEWWLIEEICTLKSVTPLRSLSLLMLLAIIAHFLLYFFF